MWLKIKYVKNLNNANYLTLLLNTSTYARITMTSFIKKKDIKSNWHLIDAENIVVGRLAAFVSKLIRGKNKSTYTPGSDMGDFVVITNIEKIKFTGNKFENKIYYRHTGHPGGIKSINPKTLSKNKPEEIFKLAVKRMLPSGPLSKNQLSKLKVYKGTDHPHVSQNPIIIKFKDLNTKNIIKTN